MHRIKHNTIVGGENTWIVAVVYMDVGEVYTLTPGGDEHPDAGFEETSEHVGAYIDGRYVVQFDGYAPQPIVGPSNGSGGIVTGQRHKYPQGSFSVRCVEDGRIIFILPRGGPDVSLDYEMIGLSSTFDMPQDGWVVDTENYDVTEVTAGAQISTGDRPTLAFWRQA
jgi:hypothetical protein